MNDAILVRQVRTVMKARLLRRFKRLEGALDHFVASAEASLVVATTGFTPDDHAKFFHHPPRETLRTSELTCMPCKPFFLICLLNFG